MSNTLKHAGPWRRAAPKAQDGCGKAADSQLSSLHSQFCLCPCFAGPASPRRIHPPPFGLPPSLRGHGLANFLNMYDNLSHAAFRGEAAGSQFSSLNSQFFPNHAGPWRRPRQRRRMDAAKPRILNFLHSILNSAFVPASQVPPLRGGSIPRPLGCPLLQGGTGLPISSIYIITNTMQPFAAQPRGLNSLASNLNSKKTLCKTQRFFTSHINPRTRMTRIRRGSTYLK